MVSLFAQATTGQSIQGYWLSKGHFNLCLNWTTDRLHQRCVGVRQIITILGLLSPTSQEISEGILLDTLLIFNQAYPSRPHTNFLTVDLVPQWHSSHLLGNQDYRYAQVNILPYQQRQKWPT